VAASPDGRHLVTLATDQRLRVWRLDTGKLLMTLFVSGPDWICWAPTGYYAASPGGERLMGWVESNGPNEASTFHPAARFRAVFYRPDVIQLLLKEGDPAAALAAADAARGQKSAVTDVEDAVPPHVAVAVTRDGPKARVTAEVRSLSGLPVTALQLLVDDRPHPGAGGLFTPPQPTKGPLTHTWELDLPPGRHDLRVLARTEASLGSSRGAVVETAGPPAGKLDPPALYVLAIGIDGYAEGNLKLGGGVKDATGLAGVFEKYSPPLFGKVEVKVLTDEHATREGVLKGLDWLKARMTARDLAVISYAGHGALEKKEFYLLPQDVNSKNLPGRGYPAASCWCSTPATRGRSASCSTT
jgi:hypothetical protein